MDVYNQRDTLGAFGWTGIGHKKRRNNRLYRKSLGEIQSGIIDPQRAKIESDIATEQSKNPFESAANKRGMAIARQSAKQMATRMFNTMGNASAESKIGMMGAQNAAVGNAAGTIAVGAEAQKQQNLNTLTGRLDAVNAQSANLAQQAAGTIGQKK